MNTVLFVAARHNATRGDLLQAIPSSHPAHPSHFNFADEISRRNYERTLRGDEIPHVRNPIVFVTGDGPGSGKSVLVREMISAIHGIKRPGSCKTYQGADAFQREIDQALLNGLEFVWFDNWKGNLPAYRLCAYATEEHEWVRAGRGKPLLRYEMNVRIYVTGNALVIPGDLQRRSRVIELQTF